MRRFGRSMLAMLVLLASMFVWAGSAAAQAAGEVVDQQSQAVSVEIACGATYCGQTFTVGITGLLTRVELNITRNTADRTVELRTVGSDGLPTNVVVATGLLPADQTDWVSIPLTPQLSVVAGSRYAIIVPGYDVFYRVSSSNPYPNGAVVYIDGGGNWDSVSDLDFAFRTYVIPPPTTPTCNGIEATIYVKDGVIVGGPNNGAAYTGTLTGTTGNDVMVGTDAPDAIDARAGNDTICGLGGNDTIEGAAGNDTMLGGPGADKLNGASGTDTTPDFNAAEGDKRTNVP